MIFENCQGPEVVGSSLYQKNIGAQLTHLHVPSLCKEFSVMRHNIGHSNVNVGVKIQTDNKDLKIWRKNSSHTMGLPMLGIKPYLSSKNCDLSNRSSIQNYQISSSVSNEFGHKL